MKKRLISLLLAFSMALTFLPVGAVSAFAAESGSTFTFNNLKYEILSDTTAAVKGPAISTLSGEITIPETATDPSDGKAYTVTAIADWAFRDTSLNTGITSFILPSSLKEIGDYAFFSCVNLKSINLPNGLTKIGFQAFQNCHSLTAITIPSSVTTMSTLVFNRCFGLKDVTFEGNSQLTALPYGTFANCESLESLTLPKGCTSIGESAFYKCAKLTIISITDAITKIEKDAFVDCPNFSTINYEGTKYSWNALLKSGNVDATVLEKVQADGFTVNYWVQPLVVSGGTFTVDGEPASGSTVMVPVGAKVEVTFDRQLFADSGLTLGRWEIDGLNNVESYEHEESFSFTMPKNRVVITASTTDVPPVGPADGSGCTGGAIAAGVAIGGAAAFVSYEFVTDVILSDLLPAGASIPVTRAELARLVWDHAGNPEPVNAPAFADVDAADDADTAKAAQWCTEQGLLKTVDGRFLPGVWVPRWKVIQVWNKAFPKN